MGAGRGVGGDGSRPERRGLFCTARSPFHLLLLCPPPHFNLSLYLGEAESCITRPSVVVTNEKPVRYMYELRSASIEVKVR
jgi:hypothetical protein